MTPWLSYQWNSKCCIQNSIHCVSLSSNMVCYLFSSGINLNWGIIWTLTAKIRIPLWWQQHVRVHCFNSRVYMYVLYTYLAQSWTVGFSSWMCSVKMHKFSEVICHSLKKLSCQQVGKLLLILKNAFEKYYYLIGIGHYLAIWFEGYLLDNLKN